MTIKLTPKKGSPLDPRGLRDLERAVIEAAREWERYRFGFGTERSSEVDNELIYAVRALEAAEKGDD